MMNDKNNNNVDEYISIQPIEHQYDLIRLRSIILKTLPLAKEVISYQMPAYKTKGIVVYFGAFKHHHSLFFRPKYMQEFAQQLTNYKTTKSAINIPYNHAFPEDLLIEMLKFVEEDYQKTKK